MTNLGRLVNVDVRRIQPCVSRIGLVSCECPQHMHARALQSRAFGACGMYSRSGVMISEGVGEQKAAKCDTNGGVVA